ncbi:uncharacterized protein LOC143304727, partial [Bombus vancouverensis nearcticus]|uniref:uncharacterized protein LOC143303267 n=1 Tax=Bombus vancouverensis nearcticus TaxID=2705178 RepID=UPI00402B0EE3
ADMCMWSEGQKAIYPKRLLKGSGRIFASFECHVRTWHELKRGLIKEFSKKINSRQVHQRLRDTKKRSDETCLAYMYRMLEIASHVDMEEEAKVEYIVEGIVDEENNKSTLYGTTSITELRKRLIMYEKQNYRRAKSIVKVAKTERSRKPSKSGDMKKTRCYNCGGEEYECAECPNRSRGSKCFKCREYGHIVSKCDNLSESHKVVSSMWKSLQTKRGKDVKIGNFELSALIDTGSELTLMRADQYVKIGASRLSQKIVEFRGIGSGRNCTLEEFSTDILIDDESCVVTIHVVSDTLMQHSLIIGTYFLNTTELNMS